MRKEIKKSNYLLIQVISVADSKDNVIFRIFSSLVSQNLNSGTIRIIIYQLFIIWNQQLIKPLDGSTILCKGEISIFAARTAIW